MAAPKTSTLAMPVTAPSWRLMPTAGTMVSTARRVSCSVAATTISGTIHRNGLR